MAAVRRSKTAGDVPVSSELEKVMAEIRKQKGTETILMASKVRQPFRIRTGIFTLDYALLGGIPHNRTTMFHGKKHSGKSTAADKVISWAQKSMPGQKAVKIDTEGTHDDTWSKKNGVDTDELILVQPSTGEDAVDIAVGLVHAKETSLVVVDSLASLVPYKEVEGSAEDDAIPGLQAKLITRMLRRITMAQIEERKRGHFVSFLVTNQHRTKIGGWSPTGEPRSLPGGNALGHFTSVEVQFKNKEVVKADGTGVDTLSINEHTFVIEKNKHNAGMRSGEYTMLRRDNDDLGLVEGDIDDAGTMLVFAKRLGWYTGGGKAGFTLEFGDISTHFPNSDAAVRGLYADREIYESLRTQLIVQNAIQQKMPEDFIDYLLGN